MAKSCAKCKKSPPTVSLKRCAKCQTTDYCSRDCQKADWKQHKKVCSSQAASQPANGDGSFSASEAGEKLSPPKGCDGPVTKPFTRLDNGTWLHDRPEKDVFKLLVDAYRLRVEDDYKFAGEPDDDSIYSGSPNGLAGFRRFLNKAQSRSGLLPWWWNPEKRKECEDLGMGGSDWSDLSCAVEKSDIIKHYGDQQFPMQLRMLAEAVLGSGPGGQDGTSIRQMLAGMEQGEGGGMRATHLQV